MIQVTEEAWLGLKQEVDFLRAALATAQTEWSRLNGHIRSLDAQLAAAHAEQERLPATLTTILHAAEREAERTMFTLTPEHGLGQIINEASIALGLPPWSAPDGDGNTDR